MNIHNGPNEIAEKQLQFQVSSIDYRLNVVITFKKREFIIAEPSMIYYFQLIKSQEKREKNKIKSITISNVFVPFQSTAK